MFFCSVVAWRWAGSRCIDRRDAVSLGHWRADPQEIFMNVVGH